MLTTVHHAPLCAAARRLPRRLPWTRPRRLPRTLPQTLLLVALLVVPLVALLGVRTLAAQSGQELPFVAVVDSRRISVRLPLQTAPTTVRIRGISAPSLGIICSDRSEQTRLRAVARGLIDSLNELLRHAETVTLENVAADDPQPDGSAGLVATVLVGGRDLGGFLLRFRLAKPLSDGGDVPEWCP